MIKVFRVASAASYCADEMLFNKNFTRTYGEDNDGKPKH